MAIWVIWLVLSTFSMLERSEISDQKPTTHAENGLDTDRAARWPHSPEARPTNATRARHTHRTGALCRLGAVAAGAAPTPFVCSGAAPAAAGLSPPLPPRPCGGIASGTVDPAGVGRVNLSKARVAGASVAGCPPAAGGLPNIEACREGAACRLRHPDGVGAAPLHCGPEARVRHRPLRFGRDCGPHTPDARARPTRRSLPPWTRLAPSHGRSAHGQQTERRHRPTRTPPGGR